MAGAPVWAMTPDLPVVAPAELGFAADKLTAIDDIVAKGLNAKKMPKRGHDIAGWGGATDENRGGR